jgi:anti-sigma B factor antagonist
MSAPVPAPRLVVEPRGGVTVAYFRGRDILVGEVPAKEAVEQLAHLGEGLAAGTLVLSLAGVVFLDSSALGKLVRLHKKLQAAGGKFLVCDLAPQVHESFTRTRLDQFLDLRPAESLDSLAPARG